MFEDWWKIWPAIQNPINAGTALVSVAEQSTVMAIASIAYQLALFLITSLLVMPSSSTKQPVDIPHVFEEEDGDFEQPENDLDYGEMLAYLLSRTHPKRGFLTASRLGKRGFLTGSRLGRRGMLTGARLGK
ncbi:hypothetical protein AAHC03_013409 [Spirometra sp. Aus1]